MTITLSDTFTDTDGVLLANHNPNIGGVGSWEALATDFDGGVPGGNLTIQTNQLRGPSTNTRGPTHRNNTDPGADEYNVNDIMSFRLSPQANRFHWLCWRMSPTGTAYADVNFYMLFGDNSASQTWSLQKVVSGTRTTIAGPAAAELDGNQFSVVVEVRNGSMAVFLDGAGTPVLSSTDIEITQRGRIGIGAARSDSSQWQDSLSVDSVLAGQDLNIPFHQQITSFFPLTVTNQANLNLEIEFLSATTQLFAPSLVNQSALDLAISRIESTVQLFQPTLVIGEHQLEIPFFQNVTTFFNPSVVNQAAQELNIGFISSTVQLFAPSLSLQVNLNVSIPFNTNITTFFQPTVFNEGEELFEPTLVGNGSLADRIIAGLIDQGFLVGTITDREYARLLAKLLLVAPQPYSINDLYSLADEDNRIAGIGVDNLGVPA